MFEICVNQINVDDMDKALRFYCDKLGFEVATRKFYPNLVPLKHQGIDLVLCKVECPSPVQYGRTAQSLINFKTMDLNGLVTILKDKGVEFIQDRPQRCPVGHYIAFKDPAGNVHEFVEFESPSTEQH